MFQHYAAFIACVQCIVVYSIDCICLILSLCNRDCVTESGQVKGSAKRFVYEVKLFVCGVIIV